MKQRLTHLLTLLLVVSFVLVNTPAALAAPAVDTAATYQVGRADVQKTGGTPARLSDAEWGSIRHLIKLEESRVAAAEAGSYVSANPTITRQAAGDPGQQAYLKPFPDSVSEHRFGWLVAISGDTLVVGNQSLDQFAYVFVRSGTTWSTQQRLVPSIDSSRFGRSVAISGDTIVVGAENADRAFVFVRSGATWSEQAILSNTPSSGAFGWSVAIDGDTIVVGANTETSNCSGVDCTPDSVVLIGAGAAYVFVRSGTTWTQQAFLKPFNAGNNYNFGYSVAISGDSIVVGSQSENSGCSGVNCTPNTSANEAGAAYVFVRSGTTWSQQAYLKASNTDADDNFGWSVAISGDTIVVGAFWEDSNATGVNGNGADNSASNAGAAYVFVRSGTAWSQQAYLKASNTDVGDRFGVRVAISGDTIVVGADFEDGIATGIDGDQSNNSSSNSGAAYVFVRSAPLDVRSGTTVRSEGTWSQQAYLKASNTGAQDRFGFSVAISGNTIVVGAWGEDSNATGVNGNQADNSSADSGAVYVFGGLGAPTAVDLLDFDVVAVDETTLRVEWSTAMEENVRGFHLWRSETNDRSRAGQITGELIDGQGWFHGAEYLFTDGSLQPDTQYYYWLQEIDGDGTVTEFGPATARTPAESVQRPDTHIRFYLPFLNR